MSKHNEYLYETDGAARAEYSAVMEAREQAKESEETAELKKRIAELESQADFEMGQKAIAREQRNKVTKRNAELEEAGSKHIEICERHVSTRKYLEKRIADLVAEHVVDEILKDERIAELQQCLLEYVNATERLWTGSNEVERVEEKATILLAKGGDV
jgi:hypothetical protein